ncbi:MAG: patatin-like phospholipase family protein [Hyphomicrobiaceae bacterium]
MHGTSAATSPRRTAFVLAGGGSLGAVQVGMLKALIEHGVKPDFVVGASVGAINGAYVAARPDVAGMKTLEHLWLRSKRKDVFPLSVRTLARVVYRRDFLLSNVGLLDLIKRNLPHSRIEDMPVPLHVVTTDFLTGATVVLSSGPAAEAIVASCAIPAAFPTVAIDGRHLADGGIASNTPIAIAASLGANRIIVFPTGHACALRTPPGGAIASALHGLTLLVSGQIVKEMETLAPSINVHVVPTLCPVTSSAYDFSNTSELIERAASQSRAWLAGGGLMRRDIPDALRPHHH